MKKSYLFILAAVAALSMSMSLIFADGADKVGAETVSGVTPTLSSTKYLKSVDGKMLLLATGIKDYGDCYELGYDLEGAEAENFDLTKYYSAISLSGGAKVWAAEDLFPGYTGMIVWEVSCTSLTSFTPYVRVGDRVDGVLVESDTVIHGTEKVVAHAPAKEVEVDSHYSYYADFGMENFASSGKAFTFEYKAIDSEANTADDIKFTIWGPDWIPRITNLVTVDVVANSLSGASGKVEASGDGWYKVTVNCEDFPINVNEGATGAETADVLYFNTVNHAFMLDNVGFTDAMPKYTVTVEGGNGGGTYLAGEQATVTASVPYGKEFSCWTVGGEEVSSDNPYSFAVTGDVTLTAAFVDGETKVMLSKGFSITLPDYDPATAISLEFDVYVTSARSAYTKVYWNLYDADNKYFGYYRITYAGIQATDTAGYSVENIGTDTYHVTLVLSELAGGSATAPGKLVKLQDNGSSANLDGAWIDNIRFREPIGKVMLTSGFSIELPNYDVATTATLEFDVYVTDARSPYTKVYWNLYDASNNYFGYYRITYAGIQATNTSGYSVESIGTDTFHVTLVLSELAGGSGTPGKLVKLQDNGSSVNLDGAWIDNIEFKEGEEPAASGKVMLTSGYSIDLPDYNAATATTLEFDIYAVSASPYAKINIVLTDENGVSTKYYRVTYLGVNTSYNGEGIAFSQITTNTWHVVLTLSALTNRSGTSLGKLVTMSDSGSSNLTGCWIDNIEFK